MSKRRICLYTQTHWDREWYWEFEKYRTQLVSVARMLIKEIDDGSMPVFHLDGQSCAIEDIIAVSPSLEEPLRKLIGKRKLRVGPWYVLADQMLVSGESLVRNLARGLKVASKYGDPLRVGYLPDTFGHTQDMPRILKGFGIDNAVVWRGVPELDDGPEFNWVSPDGSKVVVCLLPDGYYQTAFAECQYKEAGEAASILAPYMMSWLGLDEKGEALAGKQNHGRHLSFSKLTNSSLVPVGGDHLYPVMNLKRLVEAVQKEIGSKDVEIEVVDLEDYLCEVEKNTGKDFQLTRRLEGELRTNESASRHCRAYMLAGVLSSRLYLKRDNRILEHRLHQIGEPLLTTLWTIGLLNYPEDELANAERLLLLNHPHDSICGCSVDEVHRAMQVRSDSIDQILDNLELQAREEFLCPGLYEWSSSKEKSYGGEEPKGLGRWQMELNDPDANVEGFIGFNLSGSKYSGPAKFKYAVAASLLNQKSYGHEVSLELNDKLLKDAGTLLKKVINKNILSQIDSISAKTEVFGSMGGVPVFKDVCVIEGHLKMDAIPSMGAKLYMSQAVESETVSKQPAYIGTGKGSVKSSARISGKIEKEDGIEAIQTSEDDCSIKNEFFSISLKDSGRVLVKLRSGSGEEFDITPSFYDVGDAGDSYNFDPVLGDSPVSSKFKSKKLTLKGALVSSCELVHEIDIPEALEEVADRKALNGIADVDDIALFKRSRKSIKHELKTKITVRAGDPIVYYDTEWVNHSKDHRLEVRIPAARSEKISRTWSENHFSIVERPVGSAVVELPVDRFTEAPLDRFPCQRFVVANGQVFLNKGLPEYSVDEDNMVITLLRAFSMLSRKRILTRGGGAGPYMPTEEGNCLGGNKTSYGWSHLSLITDKPATSSFDSLERAAAYQLAERFMNPIWISPVSDSSRKKYFGDSSSFTGIEVSDSAIRITAMYKVPDEKAFYLRLLNVSEDKRRVEVKLGFKLASAQRVNLDGSEILKLADIDKLKLDFGVNELVTLKLSLV